MRAQPCALRRAFCTCLAGAWLLVAGSSAQSSGEAPDQARGELPRRLGEAPPLSLTRSREAMHPGEPLLLIGIEAGDNSFRDRVPALTRVENVGAQVDLEQLRASRLGLYARPLPGSRPALVPSTSSDGHGRRPAIASRQGLAKAPAQEPRQELGILVYFTTGMGVAGLLAYLFRGRMS